MVPFRWKHKKDVHSLRCAVLDQFNPFTVPSLEFYCCTSTHDNKLVSKNPITPALSFRRILSVACLQRLAFNKDCEDVKILTGYEL
jgi:hypothetical protein